MVFRIIIDGITVLLCSDQSFGNFGLLIVLTEQMVGLCSLGALNLCGWHALESFHPLLELGELHSGIKVEPTLLKW